MSDHRTTPLRPEGEDLLQAALADPFSVIPNVPRVSSSQPAPQSPPPSDPAPAAAPEQQQQQAARLSVSAAEQEAWRAEHEAQTAEWRRQSADVRARAEAERARWEERRARERAEQAQRLERQQQQQAVSRSDTGASASVSGESTSEWEAVSQRSTSAFVVSGSSSTAASPSASLLPPPGDAPGGPATDVRSGGRGGALPSSQSQGSHPQNLPRSTNSNVPAPRAAGGQQTAAARDPSDSPQWENVSSSPTSSFPSMSFPEPSRPHSPEHSHAPRTTNTTTAPAARPAMAASATLAVFDSSLPATARFWALVSSLSINMFLPFVNGVMLGFGEIFAKTVIVGWLGWGPTVATTVGLGTRSQKGR